MNNDTILLLKECDSGLKMAISSLDEVLDVIKNQKLLKEHHLQEKEPSLLAKSMSWLKMNFKIQMNDDDQTIASLLFEGCSMGIETLYKYLHQYENASSKIKEVTEKLIEIEKELSQNIQNYL